MRLMFHALLTSRMQYKTTIFGLEQKETLNDMSFSSNEILYSGTFGLMHMIYKLKLCQDCIDIFSLPVWLDIIQNFEGNFSKRNRIMPLCGVSRRKSKQSLIIFTTIIIANILQAFFSERNSTYFKISTFRIKSEAHYFLGCEMFYLPHGATQ